jgi:hypothetical protein
VLGRENLNSFRASAVALSVLAFVGAIMSESSVFPFFPFLFLVPSSVVCFTARNKRDAAARFERRDFWQVLCFTKNLGEFVCFTTHFLVLV